MANEAIHEIGKDFFLLKSTEKEFHRNIYLKRFVGADGSSVNMICDPGTRLDIGLVVGALKELIGGIENIHLVFLSHQDPDLTSNINVFLTGSPSAKIVCSVDTWRLVRMYGIEDTRYYGVENFRNKVLRIGKTGHRVQFVPAQFCHFRGAMMFYDLETKILFSGDFLGGINSRKGRASTPRPNRGTAFLYFISSICRPTMRCAKRCSASACSIRSRTSSRRSTAT